VASSIHGDPRSTNDIDFVIRMRPDQVEAFANALGPDFDIDIPALREALQSNRSWNIFFLPDFTRIDLFALPRSEYDQAAFERRRSEIVTPEDDRLDVQSPEDVVLRKLLWFQQGGGVSTQQWRDVVQVLRVQAGLLDETWLERWAPELGIALLLSQARIEANSTRST
jgi:hypothetical protein